MTTRKNQNALTAAERTAFVNAVLEIKRRGVYDTFVRQHNLIMASESDTGPRTAHRSPSFLPWHRKYLIEFELALQAVDPSVTLPYWDWTIDSSPGSSLWAADFMGGTGRSGDSKVMTGPFARDRGQWTVRIGPDTRDYLRRNFGDPDSAGRLRASLPSPADLRSTNTETVYDVSPWNTTSRRGFRNRLEGWIGSGMHNQVHVWVGGNMTTGASPNDPVFFLHHCFIDKVWADWQSAHSDAAQYLPAAGTSLVTGLNQPMAPWLDVTPQDMLDHTPFYTYA